MISSLCLALAIVGQCSAGHCPARIAYQPAAPGAVTPTPQVVRPAPVVCPAPVPLYPSTPLPNGYRYIWNGYTWVPSPY